MEQESQQDAPHRSVLFADISGSTRLYETAGNAVAMAAIARCLGLMKSAAAAAQGRVVKTIGDEIMVLFASPEAAMTAALDMQQALAGQPPVAGVAMSVHIGLHHGPILSDEGGDVFGDTVNVAARLTKLASRGQVITSRDVVDRLPPSLQQLTRYLYPIQVRGREQPVDLFEVIGQQNTELTLMAPAALQRYGASLLTLRYRTRVVEMNALSPPVTIGRDAAMTLVVTDRRASRTQATVECRGGRYVLVDHSSNGTHVTLDGEDEFVLRRDDFPLRGHGWITFGQSFGAAGAGAADECVEFFLQVERG